MGSTNHQEQKQEEEEQQQQQREQTVEVDSKLGAGDGACAAPARQSPAALRWRLLKRSLLSKPGGGGGRGGAAAAERDEELSQVSRRPAGRYDLIPRRVMPAKSEDLNEGQEHDHRRVDPQDVAVEYSLPTSTSPSTSDCGSASVSDSDIKLVVVKQRCDGFLQLRDVAVCQQNSIDSTGISCLWPAEEVLTYFCVRHPQIFQHKAVVELGAGYGLGGVAIAACTEATEVVITDGNPLVMDYVEQNIRGNFPAFGNTQVSGSPLYWSRDRPPLCGQTFDLVVAADCTFFKDFHADLAFTIKSLLRPSKDSRALLFNPRRGNTLDLFVDAAKTLGLHVECTEQYDARLWCIHQQLLSGNRVVEWPNYDGNHCYPLLITVTVCPGDSRDLLVNTAVGTAVE